MTKKQRHKKIFAEILKEIARAQEKHGPHDTTPSLDPVLLNRRGSCSVERMCEHYEIPTELRAKFLCKNATENKELTHAHIVLEEFVEAVACLKDEKAMREELIQLAAMVMNWIVSIDVKHKKQKP